MNTAVPKLGVALTALLWISAACLSTAAILDCACTTLYEPVCGEGGKTLGNSCEASCAGVKVAYRGKCADPSGCAAVDCVADYKPVCGANNVTYSNACNAECTGVTIISKGECGTAKGGQQNGNGSEQPGNDGCACPKILAPVCGSDGNTYGNECLAKCARAGVAYRGNCANPAGCAAVLCADIYAPVCGANNVTYPNECQAACTGVTIVGKGECGAAGKLQGAENGSGCACPRDNRPVCGTDGKTYSNECLAKCANASVAYTGKCADPAGCAAVGCTADYDPVCGANNVTYSNACNAECTGVTIVSKGECATTKGGQQNGGASGESGNPVCACPRILVPVCGSDGNTYGNECMVKCAKVSVAYQGNCANPAGCAAVLCPTTYAPVCGANNVTYPNECQAACTGVTIVGNRACNVTDRAQDDGKSLSCVCPMVYSPVCGKDGRTYDNDCSAACANTSVAYQGKCANPDGCKAVRCMTQYEPVCGADGKEYQNKCFAACTGVSFTPGACTPAKGARKPPRKLSPPPSPPPSRRSPSIRRSPLPPSPVSRKVAASQCAACEQEPLAPVCGVDGITYGNACLARCSGVAVASNKAPCK